MTLRQKRRQLTRWLRSFFVANEEGGKVQRRVLMEPLEKRQLLAGDAFLALLGSAYAERASQRVEFDASAPVAAQTSVGTQDLVVQSASESVQSNEPADLDGEGELVGEGEPQQDLVAFAKAIADSGTRFFGAGWCPACTAQKELFEDGGKFLPFEEVTNPDRSVNQLGIDENITIYPTWQFPDNTRATGVLSLDELATRVFGDDFDIPLSEDPTFDDLTNVSVEQRAPLHIPIDAYDPDGDPLTITVTSSDPSLLEAEVLQGNRSLRLDVQGFGDLVFELFEGRAPRPSGRIVELAEDGFYDGIIFHRVIDGFVIQGGDPLGTGTGGSSLGDFDDQYHLDLQHNSTGLLSYAKSSDDTNDSQFFITEGQQRHLDFNHSVFGQLVEGEDNRDAISNTATAAQGQPINTVTINSATVFNDTENGVVVLRPTGNGTGTATITVVVRDSDGNSTTQQFEATVINDTVNGGPFLNDIQTLQTEINTPVEFTLTSQDKEDDPVRYQVQAVNNGQPSFGIDVNETTGEVTVTPPTGFTGELQMVASVSQTTFTNTQSKEDVQLITLQVSQTGTVAPTSVDLQAGSDSGVNSSDNITNAGSLLIDVAGTVSGATVEILVDGNVVGSATATGTTTTVTVTNSAAIGEGTRTFTARQTVNGQQSDASPGLNIVIDQTGPGLIGAGTIPVSGVVGREISINLESPEESQGLTYQLVSAPTGMTLNATNGQLVWTPTEAQLGAQTFSIVQEDNAGNTTTQQFTVNVIEDPIVEIGLQIVDTSGQPITSVDVGQEFRVQLTVQDLRGFEASGIGAAFADLLYNPNVLEVVGTDPIIEVEPFTVGIQGDFSTPGLIDEVGRVSDDAASAGGGNVQTLLEIAFRATAEGDAELRLDPADIQPASDTVTWEPLSRVPTDRIEYGSLSLAVGADFTLTDDVFNFDEDASQQTLQVLSNDDPGNSTLNIVEVSTPSGGGAVSISSDGQSVLYTPAANFNGAETFTYRVENQSGIPSEATVTIQLTAVNDPPVAVGDTFEVAENSSLNILDVLANDNTGVDDTSETLSVTAVGTGSEGGTLIIGNSGANISYTPRPDFRGTETFTYTLSDGNGGTAVATVNVNVEIANPPPVAINDNFTVVEDAGAANFDVLANDTTDDPSETLSVSGVGTSQQGSVFQVTGDGTGVTYQPAPNFSGLEILTYTLRDSNGAETTGLATFTVSPVNDAPVANADSATAISGQASTTINVLENDTDADDSDTLQITSVTQPSSGSVAISSDGTTIEFTPPSNDFEGTVDFTYTISDGTDSSTATVTVDVRDFVPLDISGSLTYFSSQSDVPIEAPNFRMHSFDVRLSGTNQLGENVSLVSAVGVDGSYSFETLAPGDYTIERDPLPFLIDEGQSISLPSAVTDTTSDLQVQARRDPRFIDIRDFLGRSFTEGLTVAIGADGTPAWATARGAWSQVSTLDISLSEDTLNINAVDNANNDVGGNVSVNDASTPVYEVGRSSDFRLIRVPGTPEQAGLSDGPAAAGEGEALIAEGEAPVVAASVPTPAITGLRQDATNALLADSENLNPEGEADLSESTTREQAVDAAMNDVLPSLRRNLASTPSAQDSITSDGENDPLSARLRRLQ